MTLLATRDGEIEKERIGMRIDDQRVRDKKRILYLCMMLPRWPGLGQI